VVNVSSPSDEALLLAARRDAEAFAEFYRRHARPLAGFLVRRTGDPEAAADLLAETFAAALSGLDRFDPARGDAAAWLYGIARHQLARRARRGSVEERARRRLRMERLELTDADLRAIEACDDATVALEGLPADQRAAVHARVVQEQNYGAIAAESGSTEPAVRQRVSRGLATLRSRLAREEQR
jgi:RNA polymerase sigma factor (sigma-70 family)